MRMNVNGDQSFWRDYLHGFFICNAESHAVGRPRLVGSIREHRKRKDNKVKTVTEDLIAKVHKEWSKDKENIDNEENDSTVADPVTGVMADLRKDYLLLRATATSHVLLQRNCVTQLSTSLISHGRNSRM